MRVLRVVLFLVILVVAACPLVVKAEEPCFNFPDWNREFEGRQLYCATGRIVSRWTVLAHVVSKQDQKWPAVGTENNHLTGSDPSTNLVHHIRIVLPDCAPEEAGRQYLKKCFPYHNFKEVFRGEPGVYGYRWSVEYLGEWKVLRRGKGR